MKKRIFVRSMQKWITVEFEAHNGLRSTAAGTDESADITISVDGQHPTMTLKWRIQGKEHIGAAVQAIDKRKPGALMNILDHYTATMPLIQADEADCLSEAA